jgi:PIN domain nuclease of toxin-antitoxin system
MSDLLLDSHALLWFLWDDALLSAKAKAGNRHQIWLGEPSKSFLAPEIPRNHFELLSISLDHATQVESLAPHHRDPFDRLLIAQAMSDRLAIISADAMLDQYAVTRWWD